MSLKKKLKLDNLYAQILSTFLGTLLVIIVAFLVFFRMYYLPSQKEITEIRNKIAMEAPSVVSKIDIPPRKRQIRKIAREHGVIVLVEKNGDSWKSHRIPRHLKKSGHKYPKYITNKEDYSVTIFPTKPRDRNKSKFLIRRFPLISISLTVLLIIVASALILRKILKPLSVLSHATQEVSKGNFDYTVEESPIKEFNNLAYSFNDMTKRVKDMIEARNRLLIDVSHELRTPLTRSKLALALLPKSEEKDSLEEDIKELEYITKSILESERLSNPDLLKKETFNMQTIEKFIMDDDRLESNIESKNISADKEKIGVCCKNLIENALKYSKGKVYFRAYSQNEDYVIEVEDMGPGVADSELEKIFKPFYRVDKSRTKEVSGHGFGLYMIKKIVEAHNGKIDVRKNSESGLIFRISLPM